MAKRVHDCLIPLVAIALSLASAAILIAVLSESAPTQGKSRTFNLLVSAEADRSDPRPLEGEQFVQGQPLYIFTRPAEGSRVRFYLDDPKMRGTPHNTDNYAPFDFSGTASDGTAIAYNTSSLRVGSYTITAAVEKSAGGTDVVHGRLRIAEGGASMRPVGSAILSDKEAASWLRRSTWEPRPDNATANWRVPTAQELDAFWSRSDEPFSELVTGDFTGTTEELIQWAAWKWGINEDVLRAVAVQESDWHQSKRGDWCSAGGIYQSLGVTQVKYAHRGCRDGWPGVYPLNKISTGFNLDYYGRAFRSCFDGRETWLETASGNGRPYAAGDLWGRVGLRYSGRWPDRSAEGYITKVRAHLANRTWSRTGF